MGLPARLMVAVALLAPPFAARAQTVDPLPPETRLVSASGAAAATEDDFTIASAQDLIVTLTDSQVPAELSTATVVVTQAGTLVGSATLAPPATTASVKISGAVGQYVLRVIGAPNASYSFGTFTVCVAPQSSPANCLQNASIAGNITTPSAASDPTISTQSINLNVVTAGTYTISFADDKFPVALNLAPNLALFQGSQPVALAIQNGTAVALNSGTYTLLAIAQADQTVKAGLYAIAITGPQSVAPLLNSTFPVGGLLAVTPQSTNPTSQSLTLKISDFGFPAQLASASALVTGGATNLGTASSVGGPSTFAAPAGPLLIWSYAAAGANAGTYEVDLNTSTASIVQAAYGVNSGTSLGFAFLTPALTAGVSYQASASDFQFPAPLSGLQVAVAQNGAILQIGADQTTAAPSTVTFVPVAGPVILLVNATTPTSGNGLFDVNVQNAAASPTLVFDKTQAASINGLFDTQPIILGTAGDFNVTLTDLDFPAQLQDLALVVSSGGTILGKIFGGGTFSVAAQPGTYQLTFVATPASQQQYGLYAVQMVYSAPTVTLTASPTTVVAGGTTTLSWTTADATSCTASGGNWTSSPAIGSGMVAIVVAATTTYTLNCSGPGGATAQSVTVTATPAPSHSGGGSIDLGLLVFLAIVWLAGICVSSRDSRMSRPNAPGHLSQKYHVLSAYFFKSKSKNIAQPSARMSSLLEMNKLLNACGELCIRAVPRSQVGRP